MKMIFRIIIFPILIIIFYYTASGEKLINEISDHDPKEIIQTMPKGFIKKLKRIEELIS